MNEEEYVENRVGQKPTSKYTLEDYLDDMEEFVDISAQLPQVERKVHNRVFDFEAPEYLVEEVQDYLDDFYHEVFRTAADPCWYLKYKVEDSYPNNSYSDDFYDNDLL